MPKASLSKTFTTRRKNTTNIGDPVLRPSIALFGTFFDLLHSTSGSCAMAQQAGLLSSVAPPRRHARADARRGHRESAAIDLNKILKLGSRLYYLYEKVTISKGGRCVLRHGRSGPPTHALISLSPSDPLHTLPLTTLLALCRAARSLAWTSILLAKNVSNVRFLRTSRPHTVREAACLVRMQLRSGKVRQDQRGALHAMDPRLYMCAVPFVARAERGSHLHS
jgi:hypothetical protein